jgi:hypothetical protein
VTRSTDLEEQISLSYQEFLDAVGRMREVDFPDRARARRRMGGLRRLAEQLRACRQAGERSHRILVIRAPAPQPP